MRAQDRTVIQPKDVASMTLTVGSEDIKDVRLVASPPSLIVGRVIVDPAQAQSLGAVPITLVATSDDASMMGGFNPARVSDDLSFELPARPGRNRINLMNLLPGWTIRSVHANGLDVTNEGVEVNVSRATVRDTLELRLRVARRRPGEECPRRDVKDYTVVLFALDNRTGRRQRDARGLRVPINKGASRSRVCFPRTTASSPSRRPGRPGHRSRILERIQPTAARVTIREGETKVLGSSLRHHADYGPVAMLFFAA
jgi:hypothetical protein